MLAALFEDLLLVHNLQLLPVPRVQHPPADERVEDLCLLFIAYYVTCLLFSMSVQCLFYFVVSVYVFVACLLYALKTCYKTI